MSRTFEMKAIGWLTSSRAHSEDDNWGEQRCAIQLDAIEGSPVLDLKPVMHEFLPRSEVEQPAWSSELMTRYWLPVAEKPTQG